MPLLCVLSFIRSRTELIVVISVVSTSPHPFNFTRFSFSLPPLPLLLTSTHSDQTSDTLPRILGPVRLPFFHAFLGGKER